MDNAEKEWKRQLEEMINKLQVAEQRNGKLEEELQESKKQQRNTSIDE